MAYDEDLAIWIRDLIGPDPELAEKKMSGGLAVLIRGHMAIGAGGQGGVLVHVDPGRSAGLVAATRATTAVMPGREMPGWRRVSPEDRAGGGGLSRWVHIGTGHARSLPPEQPASRKPGKYAVALRGLPRAVDRRGSLAGGAGPVTAGIGGRPRGHAARPPSCGDAHRQAGWLLRRPPEATPDR